MTTSEKAHKKTIREDALFQREAMRQKDRLKYNESIFKQLQISELYRNAKVIFTYVSYNNEVDTYKLIETAIKDGKRVACPKTRNHGLMDFLEIHSFHDLKENERGIPEPIDGIILEPNADTLMIMPGCAYDPSGNRIGYGGGYYDRYLANYAKGLFSCIALFYSCQEAPSIQPEEYDIKPDLILNEKGFIYV